MQNIRPYMLKKAIFMELGYFESVLNQIYDRKIEVEYEYDGLTIIDDTDMIDTDELNKKLAEHFGVKEVTSFHADDCDTVGVWIIYKDDSEEKTGKWEILDDNPNSTLVRCTCCGKELRLSHERAKDIDMVERYCCTCGAKMAA